LGEALENECLLRQPHFIELDDAISRGIWGLNEERLLKQFADPVSNLINTS
jgi:hypothetical protein